MEFLGSGDKDREFTTLESLNGLDRLFRNSRIQPDVKHLQVRCDFLG